MHTGKGREGKRVLRCFDDSVNLTPQSRGIVYPSLEGKKKTHAPCRTEDVTALSYPRLFSLLVAELPTDPSSTHKYAFTHT